MKRFSLIPLAACFSLSACTEIPGSPGGRVCTRELRIHFTPPDTSILVGQAFGASVALSSCGGAELLSDVITWHSDDPKIATVNALTGRVVGRGSGQTRVTATGQTYGAVGGIEVSVAP